MDEAVKDYMREIGRKGGAAGKGKAATRAKCRKAGRVSALLRRNPKGKTLAKVKKEADQVESNRRLFF